MSPQRRLALVFAAFFAAVATVHAAPVPWTVSGSGQVIAIARSGNTVFVGGAFNAFARPTGQGVPVDAETGLPEPDYPIVTGAVNAVLSDGEGGWFIGGSFTHVGGVERRGLAHIRRDRSVAPWNPAPNGAVRTLLVAEGQLLVGGDFDHIAGEARGRAASFELASFEHAKFHGRTGGLAPQVSAFGLTRWNPDADAPVLAIAVRGRSVFLGGEFVTIGKLPRLRLAEVDLESGRATSWAPDPNHYVRALAVRGDVLYAGGYFGIISGEDRSCLAAFNLTNNELLPLSLTIEAIPYIQFSKGRYVATLLVGRDRLYVGGYFTHVNNSTPHAGLFAIDLNNQTVVDWDPHLRGIQSGGACLSLAARGSTLFLAGSFSGAGEVGQSCLAAIDLVTGKPRSWNPRPDNGVLAVAAAGNHVYLGGAFTTLGPRVQRRGLAAFDAHSGDLLPWDPSPDGYVWAITATEGVVYVAGGFSQAGGAARGGLAALDASTGLATSWNPTVTHSFLAAPVRALATAPGKVFIGGWFGGIGGNPQRSLACVDSATGVVTNWKPDPDDMVEAFAVRGDTLYVGGWFSHIAGEPRLYLAAFSIASGAVLPSLPMPNRPVERLAIAPNTLLAAGYFDSIGGVIRNGLAAIDLATNTVRPWMLQSDARPGDIHAMSVEYPVAYFGGDFTRFEGLERRNLVAMDLRSGTVLPWDPGTNGPVLALDVSARALFVGGTFRQVGAIPSAGICVLEGASALPSSPLMIAHDSQRLRDRADLIAVEPNPLRGGGLIRFANPHAGPVRVRIFDLQGRCMATLVEEPFMSAGSREARLRCDDWPVGCYLLRIETADRVSTQKVLVIR